MKRFYSDYSDASRFSLIQKIARVEEQISNKEIKAEYKALYYRRYINLLDQLTKKLKELNF